MSQEFAEGLRVRDGYEVLPGLSVASFTRMNQTGFYVKEKEF